MSISALVGKKVRIIASIPGGMQVFEGILEVLDPKEGYLLLRADITLDKLPEGVTEVPSYVISWSQVCFLTDDRVDVAQAPQSRIQIPMNGRRG